MADYGDELYGQAIYGDGTQEPEPCACRCCCRPVTIKVVIKNLTINLPAAAPECDEEIER